MSQSKQRLGEVILSTEVRTLLTGEEICQALKNHRPKKGATTFHSKRGYEVLVVTEDAMTRVLLLSP